ncbi:quinolinate synthase NadA, partial [Candidatus Bathyarchaeota archaeon]|nr:quinolinate synthase NadA [Candidatus Bathyarchaeota archaeon]
SKMVKFAKNTTAKTIIVGTEKGLLYRLQKENPDKVFIMAYDDAICPNMKLLTLDKIYSSLKNEKYVIKIPISVAKKARKALEKMFELNN